MFKYVIPVLFLFCVTICSYARILAESVGYGVAISIVYMCVVQR